MDIDSLNTLKRCSSTPTIYNIIPTANKTSIAHKVNTPMHSTQGSPNLSTFTSTSRDGSPTRPINIFAPRARRYSTGFSPLATNPGPMPRLTPRVSQLRQEECADLNSREVSHEREVHTALQISQSCEDLTLDAESWSFKNDNDLTNPLHVTLPTNIISCSSPSPTSSRTGLRLPYGLSPSPTRRTFQTRRSMSPIALRPSTLGPVKRKFELDDNYSHSYSPPPFKKIFTERSQSPCRSPSLQTCPSPDSTEGRTTPKFYVSKLYATSTNSSSSLSSSPSAAPSPSSSGGMEIQIEIPNILAYNRSNSVVRLSDTTQACKLELNSDLDGSDVDIDCTIKDVDIERKLKVKCTESTPELKPLENSPVWSMSNSEVAIQNQDLFGEHQPMLIDSGHTDKTSVTNDTAVQSLLHDSKLENPSHAISGKVTDQISQIPADTTNSTENV